MDLHLPDIGELDVGDATLLGPGKTKRYQHGEKAHVLKDRDVER